MDDWTAKPNLNFAGWPAAVSAFFWGGLQNLHDPLRNLISPCER